MGKTLRFEGFTLDLANRRLLRDGAPVELGSRYFDALVLLALNRGELVSKSRFMDEVWRGIPVTDEALTQAIRSLRRALDDDAANPRFIETVPKHGYRFVAELQDDHSSPPRPPVSSQAARIAGATTFGGLAAGLAGGLMYGLLGTDGGVAGVATIVLLTAALSLIGGAAIGAGMGLAALWRGERDWSVVFGGAAGGVVVGALGSALASHGLQSLTGIYPERVTGLFEGLALGTAAAAAWVGSARAGWSRLKAGLFATAGGAAVAGACAMAGGRFYSSTLLALQGAFPSSRIDMAWLSQTMGSAPLAAIEGAIFCFAIVLANHEAIRRQA